jgi:hypothetical protein
MGLHIGAVKRPGIDVYVFGFGAYDHPILGSGSDGDSGLVVGDRDSTTLSVRWQVGNVKRFDRLSGYTIRVIPETQLEACGSTALPSCGGFNLCHGSVGLGSEGYGRPGLKWIAVDSLIDGFAPDAEIRGIRVSAEVTRNDFEFCVIGRRGVLRWGLSRSHEAAILTEDEIRFAGCHESHAGTDAQSETRNWNHDSTSHLRFSPWDLIVMIGTSSLLLKLLLTCLAQELIEKHAPNDHTHAKECQAEFALGGGFRGHNITLANRVQSIRLPNAPLFEKPHAAS